jgi:hypothetical protein
MSALIPASDVDSESLERLQRYVDTLMAQEMTSMSMQERELCYYDIHGVSHAIDETPAFVKKKIAEFDQELATISKNNAAYLQAVAQNKAYTSARQFRLKFLRAESFQPKLAAERVLRFFEEKLKLFGLEKLTRDIKINDLEEDASKVLLSGMGQILPRRDRAGRCVLAWKVANVPEDRTDEETAITRVGLNNIV